MGSKTTWKRDNFDKQGVYQKTDSLDISQVLNDEANYNLDISGNLVVGDSIVEVLGSSASSPTGAEVENLQIVNVNRDGVAMVAVWAEQNNSDKYDIYYQKYDDKGDKVGETLLVRNHSDSHLTNLPTNEFT